MTPRTGRCLCGAITYEFTGDPLWRAHCHCASCRKQTSSPMTSFFCVSLDNFVFTSERPAAFNSSPGVTRKFCRQCGSPIAYQSVARPDQIDIYACTLDDLEDFEPEYHVFWDERVPWLNIEDELEKKEDG